MRVLLLLCQFGFLLFLFLLWLLWPKLPKLCWIVMVKVGHLCLVPDFRGNAFNFSPLRIIFAVGLSYIAFTMLRYVPSIPDFWRVLGFIIFEFFLCLLRWPYLCFCFSSYTHCTVCGIIVPWPGNQRSNTGLLHWKHRLLTSGPLRKYQHWSFFPLFYQCVKITITDF